MTYGFMENAALSCQQHSHLIDVYWVHGSIMFVKLNCIAYIYIYIYIYISLTWLLAEQARCRI